MTTRQTHRTTLTATASVTLAADGATFRAVAMQSGTGNGWIFNDDSLRASLPLWDGVLAFLDHARPGENPSVRDLAARASAPQWDRDAHQLTVLLTPCPPAGDILAAVANHVLANPTAHIGMSADVEFTASAQAVESLLTIHSLDLVINPALNGQILRATNAISPKGGNTMDPEQATTHAVVLAALLDAELRAANLPAPAAADIRARFSSRPDFTPADLAAAITGARALVDALQPPPVINHPRAALFSTEDQLQLAVDDLLGVQRAPSTGPRTVHRLTGIRELYHTLTGDYEMHGGSHPARQQLATTADFTGLVKNALNKIVTQQWDVLGKAGYDWWTKIVRVEHFNSLNDITGTLMGTVGTLPTVAEGAEYTELAIGDSPETASFVKYGGYIPLTLELIDRDETRKLAAYPRELANAGLRKISALVAAIFTSNAGAGPTMADTGALFNNTAVTTLGGHHNKLAAALASDKYELAQLDVYEQPMLVKQAAGYYGTGPKQAINARYLLVQRTLQLTAMKLIYPALENAANIYSENMQRGQPGDVIVVPEWTEVDWWGLACDPAVAPAIYVGERFGIQPEIFTAGDELSPAVFTNDEHRLKVRHFAAVWVNDFRPLHFSPV